VQADLSQVSAIQQYGQARDAVANAQQAESAAGANLQAAVAGQAQARAAEQVAQSNHDQAAARVRALAIAAYMGLGYVTPAAGPVSEQPSSNGTVTSPGGLTGTAAMDALEMIRLVAQHDRAALAQAKKALSRSKRAVVAAGQGVGQAQATLDSARLALSASQQNLTLLTRAAINPGLAATLNLPSPSSPPPPAATAPAGSTTGPTTTSPSSWFVQSDATTPVANSPTVLGNSVLSAAEMASWFASTGGKANITVPMGQLTQDYVKAGAETGVRADMAFAQSIIETGFFSFPSYGQLTGKDNNFAGIGACDSCVHGWSFASALDGVTAQLELLEAYASPTPVSTPLLGSIGIGGCCPTWLDLAGKWASSTVYGISILTIYQQMLSWVIPQRLVAAGLARPPKPTTTAPGTASPSSRTSNPVSPSGPASPSSTTIPASTTTPATTTIPASTTTPATTATPATATTGVPARGAPA
jgi:hypothetical protein